MKNLTNKELMDIEGGGLKLSAAGIGLLTGGAIAFAIGVINGFLRPLTCSSTK